MVFGMAAALALLTLACAGGKPATSGLTDAEKQKLMDRLQEQDPELRSQVDAGLIVERVAPDRLQVTLVNKTQKTLVVGPKFFGLLTPDRWPPSVPAPDSVKRFPLTKVAAGEQVAGQLRFPAEELDRPKARLVFSSPECRPAMALVASPPRRAPAPSVQVDR